MILDVNECELGPCLYGGTCINTVGSFYCECPPGRSGTDCRNGTYIYNIILRDVALFIISHEQIQ